MQVQLKLKSYFVIALMFLSHASYGLDMNVDESTKPAGGIRTDFGDVLIENLGIGRTYNLRELAGTPMKVTNTGLDTVDIQIDPYIPDEGVITQGRIEKGFEPIPSIDWITLSQTQFIVPPGESAYTDVIIKIPDDPKFYGKKYQADIYSRSVGKRFLNLGVWSHIMLTIVKSPDDQKAIEQNRKRGITENMDYTLLPDKLVITNAPLGKTLDIKSLGRTMKMANSGEKEILLRVKVVPVGSTPISLQTGYEMAPDEHWLKVKQDIFTIEPASFVDPGLTLTIPKDKIYSKKKYMFVIQVSPADPDIIGVTYYGKLYVEVE